MKNMLGKAMAVVVLAGIMGISGVEAAPKPNVPPPAPVRVEHHKPLYQFRHHHNYVLVREHRWLDHSGHRHLDRIWRDRHGHRHVEHVF